MMSADGNEDSLIVKGTGGKHLIIGPTVNGIGGGVEQENVGYRRGKFILVEKRVDDVTQWFRVPGKKENSLTIKKDSNFETSSSSQCCYCND